MLFINRCSLLVDYWPGIPSLFEGTHAIPIPFCVSGGCQLLCSYAKKRHVMISCAFRPCVQSIYPPENRNADQCRKRLLTPKLVCHKEAGKAADLGSGGLTTLGRGDLLAVLVVADTRGRSAVAATDARTDTIITMSVGTGDTFV